MIAIVYENVRLKSRVDRERKIKQEALSRVAGQDVNVLKGCPRRGACFDMATLVCDKDGAEPTLSLPVELLLRRCQVPRRKTTIRAPFSPSLVAAPGVGTRR